VGKTQPRHNKCELSIEGKKVRRDAEIRLVKHSINLCFIAKKEMLDNIGNKSLSGCLTYIYVRSESFYFSHVLEMSKLKLKLAKSKKRWKFPSHMRTSYLINVSRLYGYTDKLVLLELENCLSSFGYAHF
jgi:hypothetical protein